MKKLIDYSRLLRPTIHDLLACYDQWNTSSKDEQAEFAQQRELFVKQCAGICYDESMVLTTSGSSTGLVKKYNWGPNFEEFFLFHYQLCFGQFFHDGIVYLNYSATQEKFQLCGPVKDYGNSKLMVLATGEDTMANRDLLMKTIKLSFQKPIIWFMPTQLEIMIKKKSLLLQSLLQEYSVYHCTGEICSQGIKSFMKHKDVHLLDTMRVWNGGASFHTCRYGGLHWNNMAAQVQTLDGSLIASDYWNCSQLFWETETGDRLQIIDDGDCACGLRCQRNEWMDRILILNCPKGPIDYTTLRKEFLTTMFELGFGTILELNRDLIGVNFGASENQLAVFYEFKTSIIVKPTTKNRLSDLTGLETIFKRDFDMECSKIRGYSDFNGFPDTCSKTYLMLIIHSFLQ